LKEICKYTFRLFLNILQEEFGDTKGIIIRARISKKNRQQWPLKYPIASKESIIFTKQIKRLIVDNQTNHYMRSHVQLFSTGWEHKFWLRTNT